MHVMRRVGFSLLLLALGSSGCSGAPSSDGREDEIGEVSEATTCGISLSAYPVLGPHNNGYDPTAGNSSLWSCDDANSNSDYVGGDHLGNDIWAPEGTPVVATVAGTLTLTGWSNYSGNKVTIKDGCGWYHFYCHLQSIAPGMSNGVSVTPGQIIGYVGKTGTASNGVVHLHYSIYPDGNYDAGVDPWPYLHAVEHSTCGNKVPNGYLDGVGCDRIWGWAQDPDAQTSAIDVHLYFGGPAGDPNAVGHALHANRTREDLCGPLGSCEHAFETKPPLSLFDGQAHAVHGYAIDSAGGANAELAQSPGTMTCPATIPTGARRHVVSGESFAAWAFSSFWHVMPVDDAALEAVPEASATWPETPVLVKSDDGSPEVWLIDGDTRRHVPNPDVFAAWGFLWENIQSWPAADVNAKTVGPVLRDAPVMIQGSGPAVYMIDDAEPGSGPGGSGGGTATGGSGGKGSGGSGASKGGGQATTQIEDESGSCSVRSGESPGTAWLAWVVLGLALLSRRSRSADSACRRCR
jgi:MYXO-CTERM domain-containing protein